MKICNARSERKEFDQPIHKNKERRRSKNKAQFIRRQYCWKIFLRIFLKRSIRQQVIRRQYCWKIFSRIFFKRSIWTPTMPAKQSFTPTQVRNDPIRRYLQGKNVISVKRINISKMSDIDVLSQAVIVSCPKSNKWTWRILLSEPEEKFQRPKLSSYHDISS